MWCCKWSHPRSLEYSKLQLYFMQSFSMSFQITFQSETLTTMTVEMFLTTVQSHMSLQTDLPSECLPTDRINKALSTTLYHKVSHKVPSDSERFLMYCTYLGFDTSVYHKIKLNCTLSDKPFVTLCTQLKMNFRMYPRMVSWGPFCVKCTMHVLHKYGFLSICVLTSLSKFGFIIKTPHIQSTRAYPMCVSVLIYIRFAPESFTTQTTTGRQLHSM